MKRIVKLISVILLIALCFSMFSVISYGEEFENTDNTQQNEEQIINEEKVIEEKQEEKIIPKEIGKEEIIIQEVKEEPIVEQQQVVEEIKEEIVVQEEVKEEKQEEIKIEPVEKQEVEEVRMMAKAAAPADESQEPTEEEPTTNEPEIIYPFRVTYHFYYRGANAAWKEVGATQTVTDASFNNSKAVSFFSKQITNNNLQVVSNSSTTYTWLGTFTGEMGTVSPSDRVYTNATLFNTDTDIVFYADYSEIRVAHLTFNCDDQVANGSSSAANIDAAAGYSHTFSEPADIPAHYTFLYWQGENDTYNAGETFSIQLDTLTEDMTITYTAVYEYQPAVKVNYHTKDGTTSVLDYKDIDIYANAPIEAKWFYENQDSPILVGEMAILPDTITTTTLLDTVKEVDVFAKYFDVLWVNDDDSLLYTSSQVPYGEMPEYKGDTPTKEKTAKYTYTFNSWTPTIVPVTEETTYKATYDATINNYTITFKNYNGAILSTTQYPYGTKVSQIIVPTASRSNTAQYTYTFAGWDKMIVDVTADATYTAMYDATVNRYLITFLNYDGKILSERYYAYGTKAADIAIPKATRENTAQYTYEFAGWDRPIVDVTENAVYIANFNSDLNKYTVIWVNEDNSVLEIDRNVNYGVIPTYNSRTPSKAANAQYSYTFKGWTPNIVAVTGNAVYTAQYNQNVNTYLVTFNPGTHGTFAPQMTYVTYGGAMPAAPATPGEEGWEFTGWDMSVGGIVYGNVTFTAQWKEIPAEKTVPEDPQEDDTIRTVEEIDEYETPLAAPESWALLNLILLIVTIFTLLKFKRKYNIITPIAVLAALGLFIYTENIHNPMIWIDKWTIWQLLICAISIVSRIFAKKEEEENTDKNIEE